MVGTLLQENDGRFVKSTYSDIYHTTVSVKIDKKLIKVRENEFQPSLGSSRRRRISKRSDFLPTLINLVVDGTRRYTLDKALFVAAKRDYWQSSVRYLYLTNRT